VHLVWEENVEAGTQVFYSQRTADGAWSAPVRISNERSQAQKPQLAVDARGGLHAVWQDQLDGGHVWYVGRAPGGAWSTPTSLASGARSPVGWDDMLRLTVDGAGAAHVLWLSPAGGTLWYVRRDPGGAWSNPHSVAAAASDRVPSIAVDSGGTLHVLWQGAGRLLYARRSPDGTWSAVEDVWANPYTEYLGAEAQLAVDRQGTVHCVWPFEGQRIYYACRKADGTWSRPEDVSGSAGWSTLPQLYVDPTGWIHVVWLGYPRLRYAGCSLPAQAGRSSIAQRVQVPTGMVEPILSFFYQSDPFIPGLSSAFEVLVEHGAAATSVFSTSTAVGNWTHRWLDMSAWRGQTITLTFELRLAAGMPSARALLDDVSFGPVYPDLWVKPVGRGSALPGGQAVLHLGYGNRGGVPAAGVVVSATLPAGLAYVVADPPPHSDGPILVWNVGDLPAHSSAGAITLTLGVDPTVSLFSRPSVAFNVSTTTPEIDVTNNTDAAEVWVGKYLFLPLLRKE
jgi:uncharacterized repeat protein (TIGR01451 family)